MYTLPARSTRVVPISILVLTVACAAGCTTNPALILPDDARSADIAKLTEQGQSMPQACVYWIPLVHCEIAAITHSMRVRPHHPKGYCVANTETWGPFGLFAAEFRAAWFDDQNSFYEDDLHSTVLWGLVHRSRSLIRVPTGYRQEVQTRVLWFFNFGPFVRYETGEEIPKPVIPPGVATAP